MDRFVDFDTIFSFSQQEELNIKLKKVEPVELNKEKLYVNNLRYTRIISETKSDLLQSVTFPIIQKDINDNLFGFFFYSWSSLDGLNGSSEIYIYKKEADEWKKFAVIFVSIT